MYEMEIAAIKKQSIGLPNPYEEKTKETRKYEMRKTVEADSQS